MLLYGRLEKREKKEAMTNNVMDIDRMIDDYEKNEIQNYTENLSYHKLDQLSEQYGDAFYLLDSKRFDQNYMDLKRAFSSVYPHFNIAYSYKTNYIPKLCKIVNGHGGYAEVVSDMELEIALRCGVKAEHIIWNGPIKKADKVEMFLIKGGTINLDSVYELEIIQEVLARNPGHKFNIGIRCNFDIGDGITSRFGTDIGSAEFDSLLDFIQQNRSLQLTNLQCHFANRTIDLWPARIKGMLKAINMVEKKLGYTPIRIDFGGGMYGKMPYELKKQFNSPIPEYKNYAECLRTFAEYFQEHGPELLIEPGSALVGDCMKFVCRVRSIKKVRNKTFITVLGSQKNISMEGINPPMDIFRSPNPHSIVDNACIVGYTCIESDVLYHGYSGEIGLNDFMVFGNCGSYSIVMKPPFIMENFPILDICNRNTELIKRQEYFDDLFHTYNF